MSFFDLRFNTQQRSAWVGMKPPELSIGSLLTDLRWHNALYKMDNLRPLTRFAFSVLRLVQLVTYFCGWRNGRNDD